MGFDFIQERLLKSRKVFKLMEELFDANDIADPIAMDAMAYAFLVLAQSYKCPANDVDALLDFIKNKHRELMNSEH